MQFVNIVVHSVEDMNYRIFLQHEFRLLGLDDYIDVSRKFSRNPRNSDDDGLAMVETVEKFFLRRN